MKHVNANPLCDLTPVFKDYEKYLAGIEEEGGAGASSPESESSKAPAAAQPPSLFGSVKLQQESTFLFHGNKPEGTSEKMEAGPDKKVDASPGAASASFNFGKKIDSSVLAALNSGPVTGFSFPSGNSSLFGKDGPQSKPVSSPFSTKTLESQAGGGSNDCKGKYTGYPCASVSGWCELCVWWEKLRLVLQAGLEAHRDTIISETCDPGQR